MSEETMTGVQIPNIQGDPLITTDINNTINHPDMEAK